LQRHATTTETPIVSSATHFSGPRASELSESSTTAFMSPHFSPAPSHGPFVHEAPE
jgi:hypothetical protein